MGALAWMFAEWGADKKPSLLGIASGAVAGLVGITPAAGFVGLGGALVIGTGAGLLGFLFVAKLKHRLGYDDSLDAFGVHGICGIWGALATGIFANPAINPDGVGLLYGNPMQLWIQFVSVIGTAAYSAVATLAVIGLTRLVVGDLRIDAESEVVGLDGAFHGERGFEIQA
jgi:ammonium transporter, Amt family